MTKYESLTSPVLQYILKISKCIFKGFPDVPDICSPSALREAFVNQVIHGGLLLNLLSAGMSGLASSGYKEERGAWGGVLHFLKTHFPPSLVLSLLGMGVNRNQGNNMYQQQ